MLKIIIFTVSLTSLLYTFIEHEKNTEKYVIYTTPPTYVEDNETNFLQMIKKEHENHLIKLKLQKIKEEKEKERQRLAELKRQEEIKAIQERLRKAEEARLRKIEEARIRKAKAKALALKRKRNKIVANIDISKQRMKVYKGGKLIYRWKVSTGKRGHNTPLGSYKPTWMEKLHLSKQYNNAPMPYAVFFNSGIAVHGTRSVRRLGRRASHGCVRVKTTNARKFYALVQRSGLDNTFINVKK